MSRKDTNLILNELIQGLTFSVRQDSNALINAVYDGTSVLNVNVSGLDTSTITDFNIGTPSNGDVLVYNGTSGKWENTGDIIADKITMNGASGIIITENKIEIPEGSGGYGLTIDNEYIYGHNEDGTVNEDLYIDMYDDVIDISSPNGNLNMSSNMIKLKSPNGNFIGFDQNEKFILYYDGERTVNIINPSGVYDDIILTLPNAAGTIALTSDIPEIPTQYFEDMPGESIAAFYSGTPVGCATPVIITATTPGIIGNSIIIATEDGTQISNLITQWNSAHPTNTCSLTSGDGTQRPSKGYTISLTGGDTLESDYIQTKNSKLIDGYFENTTQNFATDGLTLGTNSSTLGNSNIAASIDSNAEGHFVVSGIAYRKGNYVDNTKTITFTSVNYASSFSTNDVLLFKNEQTESIHTVDTAKVVSSTYTGGNTVIVIDIALGGDVSGNNLVVINKTKSITKKGSHSEGSWTIANGTGAHVEGGYNVANGDYVHVEGYNNTATGNAAHVEGIGCVASWQRTHAEGSSCTAAGDTSHVEGKNSSSTTDGYYSHVEGNGAIGYLQGMHAKSSSEENLGQYGNVTVYIQTTNDTKTNLLISSDPSRIVIPTNTIYNFRVLGVGADASGNTATYEIKGTAKNIAGTVTVANVTATEITDDFTITGMSAEADDTNNALIITTTGKAATTINWSAFVEWQEITFA